MMHDSAHCRTAFVIEHNYFKPHGEHAIVSACVSRNGKKNSDGRAEFLGFLRHMHPEQCAQGAQALYLVERFDSGLEKLPSFESKESWYSIPYSVTGRAVEEGGNSKGRVLPQEVSYDTQRKHFEAAFKVCGIRSMKVTHAGRVGQAQRALQAMVSREDIFCSEDGCTTLVTRRISRVSPQVSYCQSLAFVEPEEKQAQVRSSTRQHRHQRSSWS